MGRTGFGAKRLGFILKTCSVDFKKE
jgi:hypothetical protein